MAAKAKQPWETTAGETEPEGVEPTEQTIAETPVVITLTDPVIAVIPHDFMLTLDGEHSPIKFTAGTKKIEREHAEHWYSKAHGVTIFEG